MLCLPTAIQEQQLSGKLNPTKTGQVRIATSCLTLEIDVRERLAVVIAHDKARF